MKFIDIITWGLDVVLVVMIIKSILLRRRTKKIMKDFEIKSEEIFTIYSERLNLLSKENNKLRENNEMMKERLRNLGITDFDVI